ncbi:MAG TPA: hypothetical protein VM716_14210 [Gemmatimonadales bacterium]|nr:hypothetical protein [Gemmatimonadales bacterium]
MTEPTLRNDSTDDGKKIWEEVDRAAAKAPEWVKARLKEAESQADETEAK